MSRGSPCIACIGIIGRHDNPLHISIFSSINAPRDPLEYDFMLSSSLDIFASRVPSKSLSHDFGLLQAIDENLAMYGYLTNTGVRFIIVIDMAGRPLAAGRAGDSDRSNALLGIRDADIRPAFKAIHKAYVTLLRNPFYDPDEHDPRTVIGQRVVGSLEVRSPKFVGEMQRIGRMWSPGSGGV